MISKSEFQNNLRHSKLLSTPSWLEHTPYNNILYGTSEKVKHPHYCIPIDPYGMWLRIFIEVDPGTCAIKLFGTSINSNFVAFCVPNTPDATSHSLFLPNDSGKITSGLITHEVVHIVNRVFQILPKNLTYEDDEAYAYLVGDLVDKVFVVSEGERLYQTHAKTLIQNSKVKKSR